jgi:hypothetical protein
LFTPQLTPERLINVLSHQFHFNQIIDNIEFTLKPFRALLEILSTLAALQGAQNNDSNKPNHKHTQHPPGNSTVSDNLSVDNIIAGFSTIFAIIGRLSMESATREVFSTSGQSVPMSSRTTGRRAKTPMG